MKSSQISIDLIHLKLQKNMCDGDDFKVPIEAIVNNNLCTSCGTCVGVCPNNALKMVIDKVKGVWVPQISQESCNRCNLCLKVCPGYEINYPILEMELFGKMAEDPYLGNYYSIFTGFACDFNVRYNSAAGGLVSAFLLYALEKKIIDGALVTRMSKANPFLPESFIAHTKEELITALGSKYCSVSANECLKEIIKNDGRYAVVGLPCHIAGLRKAERVNPILSKRIIFHIGLLCSYTRSFQSIDYLLYKLGIAKEDISKLSYRGHGWIGGMTLILKNGNSKFIPLPLYWNLIWRKFFVPYRCLLCNDQEAELADVSFGDVWLPEYRQDKTGTSLCVIRNSAFEDVFQRMLREHVIKLTPVNKEVVWRSQVTPLLLKKKLLLSRIELCKIIGKPVPFYGFHTSANIKDYPAAILDFLQIYFSSKRRFWSLLPLFGALLDMISFLKECSKD